MKSVLIVLLEFVIRVDIAGLEIVRTLSNLVNFMLVLESQSVTELRFGWRGELRQRQLRILRLVALEVALGIW